MFKFSPLTKKRFQKFKKIRRGWYSLIIVSALYILSLGSEMLANNQALLVHYRGSYYFPLFRFYPESTFGQPSGAPPNYRILKEIFQEKNEGNWVLMPPIPYGPFENLFDLPGSPPHPPSWSVGKWNEIYEEEGLSPDGSDWEKGTRKPGLFSHLLGTDDRGRDILVRLIYGFRISLTFSLSVTIVSMTVGVAIGCLQGFYGGWFDIGIQRFIEIWSTMPFLYILIIITSIFQPGYWWLVAIMILFAWMGMTFYMRGETYREKTKEYVQAAQALGASDSTIIFKHILPNGLTPVVTFAPFSVVGNIFSLTSLDFLGFGLPAPTPSWGELMQQGLGNISSWWLALSPIMALFVTLVLITFVGEAVREAFDPKEYTRIF